jgi:DNA-binding winged helix-turn-helix (wHTH) protein
MNKEIFVGDWAFSPATASLSRGEERRRLEHRASKVLELLCGRPGVTMSATELVEAVWNGRALSQNSVAVVIADLRRALDDDSREPRYIETIPKRGYRLLAPVRPAEQPETAETPSAAPASTPTFARSRLLIGIAGLAALGAAWIGYSRLSAAAPFTVAVEAFPTETGRPVYDPLAPAITELVTTELGRIDDLRVTRGDSGIDARVRGKVILWDDHAAVSLFAEDPETGAILWSGMAGGPSSALPRQVHQELGEFGEFVAARRRPAR